MWIIIVLIIAVVIIWIISSNNKDNEKIRDYYNATGGLKYRYQELTKILENEYEMTLKYDDGRKFCYTKQTNSGELNIGLKLEYDNKPIIFSENIRNGISEKGKNVSYSENMETDLLNKSIKSSIENISSNNKSGKISSIKKFEKDWETFLSNSNNDDFILEHSKSLFIPDDINPNKFLANYKYKKMGFSLDNKQTSSMNEILYTSPAFTDFFICAYPDVYLWAQANNSRVKAYQDIDKNPEDFFEYIENLIPFYKKIIAQYKEEGNIFECS